MERCRLSHLNGSNSQMYTIRNPFKLVIGTGLLAALNFPLSANPLDDTLSTLEEWVNTERLIAETSAQWEAEKASMETLLTIYNQEIETLTQIITDAEKDTSAAEVLRNDLMKQDEAVKIVEAKAVAALIEMEIQMKTLQPVLPPPLQEELEPLFNGLPKDPKNSKLAIGQRIQPVVAILTQVQKFNQVVTLVEDFREFEAGRTVQTETVYFGLGAAYYVDQANENAGIGVPGKDGWEWTADKELVDPVRSFVDIYRGGQQARYVNLPLSAK